jgi:hypothetical protein
VKALTVESSRVDQARVYDDEIRMHLGVMAEAGKRWPRVGELALLVEDGNLFRELGFDTWESWMMDLEVKCKISRAAIYKYKRIVENLRVDVSMDALSMMQPGNAAVLIGVSSSVRRDPEIIKTAQIGRETRPLVKKVQEKYPEQLLEEWHEERLRWEESAWLVISAEVEQFRKEQDDPNMPLTAVFEFWANERKMARQLAEGMR